MNTDAILQLALLILTAAATYGAIRQDIKNIHEKIAKTQEEVDSAHHRIDAILLERRNNER